MKVILLFLSIFFLSACDSGLVKQKKDQMIIKEINVKHKKEKKIRIAKISETEFDKEVREYMQNMKKNRSYELFWSY